MEVDMLITRYLDLVEQLYNIASNPLTDVLTIIKLSKLTDTYIKSGIILNSNTPSEILEKMLEHHSGCGGEDEEVRIHIVYNPSLNELILKNIAANDNSLSVREAALLSLAIRMSKDSDADPNQILQLYLHLENMPSVSGGRRQQVAKKALLDHPNFPQEAIVERE